MNQEHVTPDTLPRFQALNHRFGGGRPPRTFVVAAGRLWRFYYRYFGEGGIAFDDPKQEEDFRRLTDAERGEFVAKLLSLVDADDLRRIRRRRAVRPARMAKQAGRAPVIHAPRRASAPVRRPREQRPRRRVKTVARGDPDKPPFAEIPPAEFPRPPYAA